MQSFLSNIIILLVKAYQVSLSRILPSTCRFTPSCSNYMIDAIKTYGFLKGIKMGLIRIFRCHPFSKSSGWDPVK